MFQFLLVGSCLLYAWFAISFSSLSSCVLATTPITNLTVWIKECNNQTWGETVSFKNTRKLLICIWYKTIMEECACQSVICQKLVIASLCFHFCFVYSTVTSYFVPTFANNLAFLFLMVIYLLTICYEKPSWFVYCKVIVPPHWHRMYQVLQVKRSKLK